MSSGYYRYPTIHADNVVFVCEDDLWAVSAAGGVARRLTSNLGLASRPVLSPDGSQLAFSGREEGQPEIFVMAAAGGPARRLTHMGSAVCRPVGWRGDDQILFATNATQPFGRTLYLHTVDTEGNAPERINVGPAAVAAYGPNGGMVIGRNTASPAYWKRYRGGSTGQLWVDEKGDGEYRTLLELTGNTSSPMWLMAVDEPAGRVFFLSDHEGVGNLYSCRPDGTDLNRHTDHEQFYARSASTDGERIVYHAGADLYLYDPVEGSSTPIPIEFHSPQTQRNRKFVRADKFLDGWALHPEGHAVAITSRGKAFSFGNWEGAVLQHGEANGARYRLLTWLNDGERLIGVTDDGGEEAFVILNSDGTGEPVLLTDLDTGRPVELAVNPKKDEIVFSNHRYEILHLDLETGEMQLIDRGKASRIAGFAWSPDGAWVAYSVSVSLQVTALKLWQAETGEIFPLTQPVLADVMPAFDPGGKYLYFLSYRHFDPVYDNMQFDLSFPRGMRPYLITLQKDLPSPFIQLPRAPGEKNGPESKKGKPEADKENAEEVKEEGTGEESGGEKKKEKQEEKPIQIDVEGIEGRVIAFPVDEALYGRIVGMEGGKLLYSRYPVEGALNRQRSALIRPSKGALFSYDLTELKEEMVLAGISDFLLTTDTKRLIYRAGNRLRVLKSGMKPDKQAGSRPGRKSGWLDLGRAKVQVVPAAEWRQMYREAWRLQRDQFWSPDMSQVDWLAIYERYLPLLDKVGSRSEFSDLMWEMQGELGTSHCYEMGGDYRTEPKYDRGHLGADFSYDEESGRWQIDHIVQGDSWDKNGDSPLNGPGIGVEGGDYLLAVNGRGLSRAFPPEAALVNLAGEEVILTFAGEEEGSTRTVTVRTLRGDSQARYREWVEGNRQRVHQATDGRIGYVHIPDMGARGYAEFHRGFLAEVDREGLIVDVRFNGGGHVSPLILEKLARRRIGRIASRWGQEAAPFPRESVAGPMVALTNEHSGSDGDIFSHCFKLMGLGPLLGKRTWGGVVGIHPRHPLVDGTMTTQPEFSFWFTDVGWGVENYGTDPDIEIDNRPQDYINGVDAQLERTIEEIMTRLEANPSPMPEPGPIPSRALPKLPPR